MNPTSISSMALALQFGGKSISDTILGLAPMLLIFVIFYVVLMLPMQRQRKALQQVIESLKKGDKVITTGGLYGEVVSVDAATVILRIADNVRVKVARSAISGLEGEPGEKGNKGSQSS
jgi:preprotein translocase subunit YajC